MTANQLGKMFPKFTIKKFAIKVKVYPLFQISCKIFDVTVIVSKNGGDLNCVTTKAIVDVTVTNHACWKVTPCRLVAIYTQFPGTYCFHPLA